MAAKKGKKTNKKSAAKKTNDAYTLNQIGDAFFNFINSSTEQFKKTDN